ncbi:MAG: NAD(P)(+) transhydrogenase (Re/Si-specific) subunit beta [Candidatus Ancillula trichonymphae]|jgi:NAD(P) transhydrogenase subunit beta|nr:NAD(P)(+) transhydrogenase (Re/Si-specific) subunit beta [Candidatus Ancillula trichonymphae]
MTNKTNFNLLTDFLDKNLEVVSWGFYVLAAVLFIQGLRLMNSPKTAQKGNKISIIGMLLAVIVAFFTTAYGKFENVVGLYSVIAGGIIGVVLGVLLGRNTKMTSMPQLVSLFNTVGGGAAALVAINDIVNPTPAAFPKNGQAHGFVEVINNLHSSLQFTPDNLALIGKVDHIALLTAVLGIFIGCVTFTGSLIAAGKLQGILNGKAIKIPGSFVINILCIMGVLVTGTMIVIRDAPEALRTHMPLPASPASSHVPLWVLVLLLAVFALIFGVTFVLPIGGADMPVVISVLNACTGTAVAMTGFVINNVIMIVAGALVGAAGAILSQLMAKAMNRSLVSVLAGGFGSGVDAVDVSSSSSQVLKETSADDLAIQMVYAKRVVIVPGYGLAVAGAQHEIAELTNLLEDKDVEVLFAIHPVAGRMPGHMNVLLAEANIPYEKLLDLDDANLQFLQADVALVVGANDVINPAARRAGSSISGMPILNVDEAKTVVVIKRGQGKGYAGIENELYGLPQTSMLYGDAKKMVAEVVLAVKEL